ncbi:hypothetical protein Bca101_087978 [Brassica carinata]
MIIMKEISVPDQCLLCAKAEETTQHLFFDCTYSTQHYKLQYIFIWKERNAIYFITILLNGQCSN